MNTYDPSPILSDGTVVGGYMVNIGDGTLHVPQVHDYFLDASFNYAHIENCYESNSVAYHMASGAILIQTLLTNG